jgi:hypothetical protein
MLSTDYRCFGRYTDYSCQTMEGVPLAALAGIDDAVKLTHDRGYKVTRMTAADAGSVKRRMLDATRQYGQEFMLSYAQAARIDPGAQMPSYFHDEAQPRAGGPRRGTGRREGAPRFEEAS